MLLIIQNFIGFAVAKWRYFAVGGAILLTFIVVMVAVKRPGPRPKVDEATLQKINSANETTRIDALNKTVDENEQIVTTVGNRSTIVEVNRVERERETAEKVAEVNQKIAAAKADGRDVTQSELECMLVPGNCP
jgi:phage tail sheath protein FI